MVLRIIILTGSFLTVACLAAALCRQFFFSRRIVKNRLTGAGAGEQEESPDRSVKDETYRVLGRIGKVISGRSYLARLQVKLNKARILIRAEELVGLSVVCGLAALLLGWVLVNSFPAGLACGVAGYVLPVMVVEQRRRNRLYLLNQQLPDALDIIANGLRAGFSFTQAINVLVQEMDPPIADEFARMLRKNQMGKPMADVLQELARNSDSDDFEMMVTALLIQRQVGGNLAEILDNVAHTIRERVRIKGEIKTLTAQGRFTAVVISLLPPGVMLMIFAMNPGYMKLLFTEPLGLIMFGTAVFLQLLGIMVLRRIINIEL